MALGIGIVGLPNVGKSTTFNALTKAQNAQAANYPFCTIEPNKAIVPVRDPRCEKLAEIVKPERILPATVEFVDIAGLVAGASKGEGLGNQFLANIRETDAITHVVRCFEDDNVIHVAGKVDPLSGLVMALSPGRTLTVAEQFDSGGQARANLKARARLAVGPEVGRSEANFADDYRLTSSRTRGSTVLLTLRPRAGNDFPLSSIYDGPVVFATC